MAHRTWTMAQHGGNLAAPMRNWLGTWREPSCAKHWQKISTVRVQLQTGLTQAVALPAQSNEREMHRTLTEWARLSQINQLMETTISVTIFLFFFCDISKVHLNVAWQLDGNMASDCHGSIHVAVAVSVQWNIPTLRKKKRWCDISDFDNTD